MDKRIRDAIERAAENSFRIKISETDEPATRSLLAIGVESYIKGALEWAEKYGEWCRADALSKEFPRNVDAFFEAKDLLAAMIGDAHE